MRISYFELRNCGKLIDKSKKKKNVTQKKTQKKRPPHTRTHGNTKKKTGKTQIAIIQSMKHGTNINTHTRHKAHGTHTKECNIGGDKTELQDSQ